ncbi:MAG TPA: TerC family protein [Bryobacteraceae bacterium]|nr:TerC family protein [Bryobacteraceae bacterium]
MPVSQFLLRGLSIVLIDLLLAGDNALVIAMAVRGLPRKQRRWGIICGAALAVVLRVALTAVAARLLTLPFLKLAGGLLVLWIAYKVMVDVCEEPDAAPNAHRLVEAIWYITAADLTMSVDNILAIAGASGGHFGLIVFGLGLSIPFVVFSSNLLSKLMDRFPVLVYLGVAILAKVAADMVLTDPFIESRLHPSEVVHYIVMAAFIAGVLIFGTQAARAPRAHRAGRPAPRVLR